MTAEYGWFEEKAREMGGEPVLYIEGYEWTGFAWWKDDRFVFPPGVVFGWSFSEMWRLRLFGGPGEWHCWKTGDNKWTSRFARACDWLDKEVREYVLWDAESGNRAVWVPFETAGRDLEETPLQLVTWFLVDQDETTGQAMFADMMLREVR